jgi:hypothetical protein
LLTNRALADTANPPRNGAQFTANLQAQRGAPTTMALRRTQAARNRIPLPMLNWLVGSIEIFGVGIQNWMVLMAASLVAYIATLAFTRRNQHTL